MDVKQVFDKYKGSIFVNKHSCFPEICNTHIYICLCTYIAYDEEAFPKFTSDTGQHWGLTEEEHLKVRMPL